MQLHWMNKSSLTKKIPLRTTQLPCFYCGGEASVRSPVDPSKEDECNICYGVGNRRIMSPNENREICPICVGMGRTPDDYNHGKTCPTCNGWGVIMVTTYTESDPIVSEFDKQNSTSNPTNRIEEEKVAPLPDPVTNSAAQADSSL